MPDEDVPVLNGGRGRGQSRRGRDRDVRHGAGSNVAASGGAFMSDVDNGTPEYIYL